MITKFAMATGARNVTCEFSGNAWDCLPAPSSNASDEVRHRTWASERPIRLGRRLGPCRHRAKAVRAFGLLDFYLPSRWRQTI